MLAKGHHFQHVTLVVIVDADASLLSPDFRSTERMGQLLTQVAGRSGRGKLPGNVLVQTYQPHHPVLQILLAKGYGPFARQLLAHRRKVDLPPYQYLALVRAESKLASRAESFYSWQKQPPTALENLPKLYTIQAHCQRYWNADQ